MALNGSDYILPDRQRPSRLRKPGTTADRADNNTAGVTAQLNRQQPRSVRIPIQPQPQNKGPGRTVQDASIRRPSIPTPTGRPPLTHQTQSWGSTTTSTTSATARSHRAGNGSTSSSSGMSQDSISKSNRNPLRRKQSSVGRNATDPSITHPRKNSVRTDSSSSVSQSGSSLDMSGVSPFDRGLTESPMEIRTAQTVELPKTQPNTVTIYPELDRYRNIEFPPQLAGAEPLYRLATHDLPPPTPAFSGVSSQLSAASPSTRFSESPGPSPYSRDTTPTSISSQSPGLVAPMRFKPRQLTSPAHTRPPVTRRRGSNVSNENEGYNGDSQGLAAVRETLTSSSSNSTVRDGERRTKEKTNEPKTGKGLPSVAPSPPPRKSSNKFSDTRSEAVDHSPKKTSQATSPAPLPSFSPDKSLSHFDSQHFQVAPPMRPSRENTPDLRSQLFEAPSVVHSNLTAAPHTNEQSKPTAATSRKATPSPHPEKPASTRRPSASRVPGPSEQPEVIKVPAKPGRTPSPNTTFNTRFLFFGRRNKGSTDSGPAEKKEKPARKGPAAGTGHEGYGRLGSTRRKSGGYSSNGRVNAGPGTSQESLSSNGSIDPFLQQRMSPVIISGGEVKHNRNASSDLSRIDSNQSILFPRPSTDSRLDSDSNTISSAKRTALWASGLPSSPRAGFGLRRPSDSSDSEAGAMRSNLAFRRSTQKLPSDSGPLRLPKPINTSGVASPSVTSIDDTIFSDDSHVEAEREMIRGRRDLGQAAPKKLTKRARSPRKWNLFSRSQGQKKKKDTEPVSAAVKPVQQRSQAYYTMMDGSEQEEEMAPPTVEDILRDAHVFDGPHDVPVYVPTPPPVFEREHLPSRPEQQPDQVPVSETSTSDGPQVRRKSKFVTTSHPQGVPGKNSERALTSRPSRLPQVGRIPKVVNTRAEQSTLSVSFSRPFNRMSFQDAPAALFVDHDSIAKGPSPPTTLTPELTHEMSTETSGETCWDHNSHTPPSGAAGEGREFLAFSPLRHRAQNSSSSSDSCAYVFSQALAAIPDPAAPLVEDEIWDEYNDLIGDVPLSATSSKGVPFHLESYDKKVARKCSQALESPTIILSSTKSKQSLNDDCRTTKDSSTFSADMTERIQKAFAPKIDEEESCCSLEDTPEPAAETTKTAEQRNSQASRTSRKTDSSCSYKSSDDDSPLSQVNLRVGSMTVSKWLSFGHVLFSPVRDQLVPETGSLKRHSILVIDGLGNDDWSFYAAETYPAATFFNMSPRAPLPKEHQAATNFPLSPPNHHQIKYTSHADKFPFGAESFTSVVFRFPVVAPESHYRNILDEARRVLKPGGYLELSILDVDLNNMGNRGRKAVRQLKESIHSGAPETSISATSDLILRHLGHKNFVDIKSCRVGVPVANVTAPSVQPVDQSTDKKSKKPREQRSLAEMMNDNSETADESITKMVAKVGRWWYTRCYESAAGANPASKSIWSDRALLSECEELRTSLKLMVCHARMPDRPRVASV